MAGTMPETLDTKSDNSYEIGALLVPETSLSLWALAYSLETESIMINAFGTSFKILSVHSRKSSPSMIFSQVVPIHKTFDLSSP